ncbi:MAG: hypothetical protein UY63_C0004G0027 [Parcubacteria group bacterium GW2011_GWA2_51_10]|nr:MAG: hypothetical protein UY63_C0004G0027 [Parcubacteria group bacterium GW2011_GWA2_51_10]
MKKNSQLRTTNYVLRTSAGFTLVETFVAVVLLSVTIVAPMMLTVRSLSSAYYARDQVTAFHLAQEAIEVVRHIRDSNILKIVYGESTNLFAGIPSTSGEAFYVDAPSSAALDCGDSGCPLLTTDGELYGYGEGGNWRSTKFTRAVRVTAINPDELRVAVTVSWKSGPFKERTFTISENVYRWVEDGSAI